MLTLASAPLRASAIAGLDPSVYACHALHGEGAVWGEKNCYVDLWIELVHALGGDPHPMLGVALAIDFEGDQWTFFKPSHDDLRAFYGLDVQELTMWRPLAEHAIEHLSAGKLISVEADAYWLPDTAGTDYRRQHTKTTIALAEIDLATRRLIYFHNAGCFALEGDDFARTFALDAPRDAAALPLFAEFVRTDRLRIRPQAELRAMALSRLPGWLGRRPIDNPVRRFQARFEADLPALRERGLDHYHSWAFGSTRQLGAAFELGSRWLTWALPEPGAAAREAVQAFDQIAASAKTLILKGARAVMSSKPADLGGLFGTMADAWDAGFDALARVEAAQD
jgi:hypothetical protein